VSARLAAQLEEELDEEARLKDAAAKPVAKAA
jgi:hypothetical protein